MLQAPGISVLRGQEAGHVGIDEMVAPVNCALSEVIFGLEKVRFGFGETIVIQGAGGLGIYATAVAREMGAEKIIVVEGIDERIELVKSFGADEIVDMKQLHSVAASYRNMKKFHAKISKWGTSLGVRIPKELVEKYKFKDNEEVTIIPEETGLKIIPT